MARLPDRSTGDLLVLLLAGTVCVSILVAEISIVVLEALDPDANTTGAAGSIGDVINTLVGLVAGYLAGRTEIGRLRRRGDDDE